MVLNSVQYMFQEHHEVLNQLTNNIKILFNELKNVGLDKYIKFIYFK